MVFIYLYIVHNICGPGSSVGIATHYGLDGTGSKSRWGRDFPPVQTYPGAHPASCTMGTGSFPGVKCGRGVLLTTHTLLVPRSWKSRAKLLPTLWVTPGLYNIYIYIKYIYTGCPRRNVPDFGRVFLMLNYTDKTQNTYVQS